MEFPIIMQYWPHFILAGRVVFENVIPSLSFHKLAIVLGLDVIILLIEHIENVCLAFTLLDPFIPFAIGHKTILLQYIGTYAPSISSGPRFAGYMFSLVCSHSHPKGINILSTETKTAAISTTTKNEKYQLVLKFNIPIPLLVTPCPHKMLCSY